MGEKKSSFYSSCVAAPLTIMRKRLVAKVNSSNLPKRQSVSSLSLTEAITKQGAFYLYTGIAILGFLTFFWILPETRGKSLEEVEQLFAEPPKVPCLKRNTSSL